MASLAAMALGLLATVALLVAATHAAATGQPLARASRAVVAPLRPGKLIVDVDAGADDAMGLLLALAEQQRQRQRGAAAAPLQLLAITCTHGNTPLANVERNVLKTLDVAGRLDVPVYSGASQSLITTPPGDNYFGLDGFGDFVYENAPEPSEHLQKEHAVNALVRLAKENPGEITLLALGPLSNIGLATRIDPDFLSNLQQVVIMGGASEGLGNIKPATEFNFFIDPEADFIVFNSSRNESKPIYIVPWDTVAARNLISMDWRTGTLGKVGSKYVDFLNKAENKVLLPAFDYWMSADPITAGLLLRPELITASEQHHVDVEMHGDYGRGALFVDYNDVLKPKNTVIIKSFDVDGYKELLLENLA